MPPNLQPLTEPSPSKAKKSTPTLSFQSQTGTWNTIQNVFVSHSNIPFTAASFVTPPPYPSLHTQRCAPYTSPSSTTSLYSSPGYTPLHTSPYTSPNIPYTPTQQMSPITQLSPYPSPLNQSSPFVSSSVQVSPNTPHSSPFSSPGSLFKPQASSGFQSTPLSSSQLHITPKTICPVVICPSNTSPQTQDKEGSNSPTGPLSPLIPPPDLEISYQVPPSHALAPPVPLSRSPSPPKLPVTASSLLPSYVHPANISSTSIKTFITSSIFSSASSIPTSFSIPHLSCSQRVPPMAITHESCLPISSPSSLPTQLSLPPSLSSSLSSVPIPHLPTSPLPPPPPSLFSLVHPSPMSLVPSPPSSLQSNPFIARGCRKFSCTKCMALFNFESSAKQHFITQHATGKRDKPINLNLIQFITILLTTPIFLEPSSRTK